MTVFLPLAFLTSGIMRYGGSSRSTPRHFFAGAFFTVAGGIVIPGILLWSIPAIASFLAGGVDCVFAVGLAMGFFSGVRIEGTTGLAESERNVARIILRCLASGTSIVPRTRRRSAVRTAPCDRMVESSGVGGSRGRGHGGECVRGSFRCRGYRR